MKKRLIRLTESDLHKIVKESVNKILKEYTSNVGHTDKPVEESAVNEAYGTPSTYNKLKLQQADDAQNLFANYGGGKFKDRDLHALTTIAKVADTLHYNSQFLPANYENVVEKMAEKLSQISTYLQNKIQMKTGLQPTTMHNYRYNVK